MGGDNLVGDQLIIYLDESGVGGIDEERFKAVINLVKASYLDLFAFRTKHAKGLPIIGHCYDYALPNGVTPICTDHAWLKPSLDFAGYAHGRQLEIVVSMIDKFHDMLKPLADDLTNNFFLADTRKTLKRDPKEPLGWANEIHPFPQGFNALAEVFLSTLQKVPDFRRRI